MTDKRIAIAAGAATVAVLLGTWVVSSEFVTGRSAGADIFAGCRPGAVAGGSIGGPFTLVNGDGVTVTDQDVFTRPSVLYFGYTFCPDICPMDVQRNAFAVEELEARGIEAQPVFISIDPERDTPEVVGAFVRQFHDRGIGLTGTPEQVRAASQAYRTYYQKRDAEDEFYLVDHSVQTYLVLPGHGYVDFVNREATPEEIADRMQCFVEAAARVD